MTTKMKSKRSLMFGRHKWRLLAVAATIVAGSAMCIFTSERSLILDEQHQVVGFSKDGSVLATINQVGKGCLWDPETGESREDLAGDVTGLRFPFSPDGRYCVELESVNQLSRRVLVEMKTGEPIFQFDYPVSAGFYHDLAFGFTPDGRYFYSPISDTQGGFAATSVWSLPDGNQVHLGKQVTMAVSPDGEHLAIASVAGNQGTKTLELFSIADQVVELSFEKLDSFVTAWERVAFSTAGDRLVVCWDGGFMPPSPVKVLDIRTNQILAEHEIRTNYLLRPRFIHDDQLIAVHQDSDTGPIAICLAKSDHSGIAWKVDALSPNDQWGVAAFRARDALSEWFEVNVFKISPDQAGQVTNQFPVSRMKLPIDQWGYPPRCSISNDASRVAVSFRYDYSDRIETSDSSKIAVIDVASQELIWTWRGKDHPHNMQLSPDGRFLAFEDTVGRSGVKVFPLPKPE